MNKPLIALAVLGSFAGAASAQTSVTVYGLVDAGIVTERGGPGGNVTKLTSGVQNGSRLGFRGTEDLGGGLSAKFVLESGFGVDDGRLNNGREPQSGRLFGRQAFVGLGGNWGNVTFGRQYTPHFLALDQIDPFHSGLAGNAQNLMTTIPRTDNTIKYSTPEWSGFIGELAYTLGEQAGDNTAGRQIGLSVGYTNGPLLVTLAHQRAEGPIPLPGQTITDFERPALPGSGVAADDRAKRTLLGGRWDFGVAAASLAFASNKDGLRNSDSRNWLLGVSVPFGPSTLLASYVRVNDREALNQDANQWALGYTYAVSRRTNLYTSFARINNKRGAPYTVGSAVEAGSGDKAFNVGIRHTF